MSPHVRIGISGWRYDEWRGIFYPEGLLQKRELAFASRMLATIELNGTFHSLQTPESFRAWHDETPEHFVFAAHYLSFSYLFSLALWPIRYFTGLGPGLPHRIIAFGSSFILFLYVWRAMKRVYGTGFFSALFAYAGIWVASILLMIGPFIAAIVLTLTR